MIAHAVIEAGGKVELTSKNRLKIIGPAGIAIVGTAPGNGHVMANTLANIKSKAGLNIHVGPGIPGHHRSKTRASRPPGNAPGMRAGTLAMWHPSKPFGFLTGDDGQTWFVDKENQPEAVRNLPEGAAVRFRGSTVPRPGKRYPEATHLEADSPPDPPEAPSEARERSRRDGMG